MNNPCLENLAIKQQWEDGEEAFVTVMLRK